MPQPDQPALRLVLCDPPGLLRPDLHAALAAAPEVAQINTVESYAAVLELGIGGQGSGVRGRGAGASGCAA